LEGYVIDANFYNKSMELINDLEVLEKNICNLSGIFAEILKDEINANDEQRLFNGFKRIIKKYSQDKKGLEAIDELIRVLCGGASINEILQVAKEECMNPTLETEITLSKQCNDNNINH
jgi:tRNA A37 threonylcarbamoyltransferase TsaD